MKRLSTTFRHKSKIRFDRNRTREATKRRLRLYGNDMVTAYEAVADDPLTDSAVRRTAKLKRDILEKKLGRRPRKKTIERIQNLNLVAGLPLLNVGWNCMSCQTFSNSEMLFDIDHIVPLSDGGNSKIENLQLLCPNCHKRKTYALDGFTIFQSFRHKASSTSIPAGAVRPHALEAPGTVTTRDKCGSIITPTTASLLTQGTLQLHELTT